MKKTILVGNIAIGGNHPIVIQSMTNTKTSDVENTIKQINELVQDGAQLVRVAVSNMDDALAISKIKEKVNIPLVADVHFDYRLAIQAVESGIDKLRINPGNIKDPKHIEAIVSTCKKYHVPIRIGINAGSIDEQVLIKCNHNLEDALIASAINEVSLLESLDFYDIIISIKSSDIETLIKVNRIADKTFEYPLHIGLTEAGDYLTGTIRSAYALGTLLKENIGSTIRVSLTGNPIREIQVAKEILKMANKYNEPTIISCPTCGRTEYDMESVIKAVRQNIVNIKKPLKIAIMGCVVNGPGEAKNADIGIAGGKNQVVLFKKGKIIKKLIYEDIIPTLLDEINKL